MQLINGERIDVLWSCWPKLMWHILPDLAFSSGWGTKARDWVDHWTCLCRLRDVLVICRLNVLQQITQPWCGIGKQQVSENVGGDWLCYEWLHCLCCISEDSCSRNSRLCYQWTLILCWRGQKKICLNVYSTLNSTRLLHLHHTMLAH